MFHYCKERTKNVARIRFYDHDYLRMLLTNTRLNELRLFLFFVEARDEQLEDENKLFEDDTNSRALHTHDTDTNVTNENWFANYADSKQEVRSCITYPAVICFPVKKNCR